MDKIINSYNTATPTSNQTLPNLNEASVEAELEATYMEGEGD